MTNRCFTAALAFFAFLCHPAFGLATTTELPNEVYFSTGWCPRPEELAELSKHLTLTMNQCCIRKAVPNEGAEQYPELLKPWAHHIWTNYYPSARCDGRYLSVEEDAALRSAYEQEVKPPPSKPMPLACPQCGFWHISSSSTGLEGDIMIVDESDISIPNCGSFSYEVKSSSVRNDGRPDRHTYTLDMALRQWNSSTICQDTSTLPWSMTVSVSGHFQEGGMGDFVLRRPNEATEHLSIVGWNSQRENPCDSGSSVGSLACLRIANARLFKAFSIEVSNAYSILLSQPRRRKILSFNPALFAADVLAHCSLREKGSGGYSWPYVWALACQSEIIVKKLEEFRGWRYCTHQGEADLAKCPFPSGKFDRTMHQDE